MFTRWRSKKGIWKPFVSSSHGVDNEKARQVAEDLKNIVLNFTKKASETGKLFASLTKEEIAAQLSKIIGAKVKPDSIDLKEHGEHIKQEGEHMIEVNLAPNIKVELKVFVKS